VQAPRRYLTFNKGAERFVFRGEKGREAGLLRAFLERVEDERSSFGAFDAAVLGSRLMRIVAAVGGVSPIAWL